MGNQVRTLCCNRREEKQKNETEKVKTGKIMEAFYRTPVLSTIFEDNENPDSDNNDISEEENNKERTVNGRIPEVSSGMENEDNTQQEPAELGKMETSETSETPEITETTTETPEMTETPERVDSMVVGDEGKTRQRRITLTGQDSIAEFITEDNVQQIIDGIIEETNLSDLETGKIY